MDGPMCLGKGCAPDGRHAALMADAGRRRACGWARSGGASRAAPLLANVMCLLVIVSSLRNPFSNTRADMIKNPK